MIMKLVVCIIAVCLGLHYAAGQKVDGGDLSSKLARSLSDLPDDLDFASIADDDFSLISNGASETELDAESVLDGSEWMILQMWNLASSLPPLIERDVTICMQTVEILMIRVIEALTAVRARPVRRLLIAVETMETSEWMVRQILNLASNLPGLRERDVAVVMETIEVLMVHVIETITAVKTQPQRRIVDKRVGGKTEDKQVVVTLPDVRKTEDELRAELLCINQAQELIEAICTQELTDSDRCQAEVMLLAETVCSDPQGGIEELQTTIAMAVEQTKQQVESIQEEAVEIEHEQVINNQAVNNTQAQSKNVLKKLATNTQAPPNKVQLERPNNVEQQPVINTQAPPNTMQKQLVNNLQAPTNNVQQQPVNNMMDNPAMKHPNRMTTPPQQKTITKNVIVRVLKEIVNVLQGCFTAKKPNTITGQQNVVNRKPQLDAVVGAVPKVNDLIGGIIEEGANLALDLALDFNNKNAPQQNTAPAQQQAIPAQPKAASPQPKVALAQPRAVPAQPAPAQPKAPPAQPQATMPPPKDPARKRN